MSPYDEAHLFVAAIRILLYQKKSPPTIDDVCTLLNTSVEAGISVCRSLQKSDIIEMSQDPFSTRLTITDHLKIEGLPKTAGAQDSLAKELEQFKNKKQAFDKEVEAIKADLKKKRQNLHNGIEEKLREEMRKMKGGA